MAQKNEAKIRFSAETREFNQEIRNMNSELAELRSELKLNQTQMEGAADKTEYLQEQYNIMQKQLEISSDKTALVSEKLEVAIRVYGENSTEVNKLRIELNNARIAEEKLKQAVENCANAIEDAGNDMEEMAAETEKAGEKAEKASEGYTIMKDVVANLAADAIQSCIDAFAELAVESEKTLDKLQASTGASDAAMQKYKETMQSVYEGGYGENLEDVGASMSTIIQLMGEMENNALESVTKQAITLRDIYDMDIQESIRTVDQMMKQFGISADEAFNLIVQGNQKGLNANGDLLDILNEYSVHYKQLGLSAEDMFTTLAGAAEEGVFSLDKVGDAYKELGIRVRDGSDSTAEAFEIMGYDAEEMFKSIEDGSFFAEGMITAFIDELAGMPESIEKTTAGVALFGTMWEDLGAKALGSSADIHEEFDKTKNAMEELDSVAYGNVESNIEKLGRALKDDLLTPLVDDITPEVEGIVEWSLENLPLIEPILVSIVTALGGFMIINGITSLIHGAAGAWSALNLVMAANPIGIVVVALAALAAGFVTAYNQSETFRNTVDGLVDDWETGIGLIADEVESFVSDWNAGIGIIQDGIDDFVSSWNAGAGIISDTWDDVTDMFENAGETAGEAIDEAVTSAINSVLEFGVDKINGFIESLNFAIGIINNIPGVEIGMLDMLEVPQLATGGIATRATLAVVGEGREEEAIAPISTLQGYVEEAVETAGNASYDRAVLSELQMLREEVRNSRNIYMDGQLVSKNLGPYDDANAAQRAALGGRGVAMA